MADDKTLRAPQDSSRIALGEDYEVAYRTDKFGVTKDELVQAVDTAGKQRGCSRPALHIKIRSDKGQDGPFRPAPPCPIRRAT